MRRVKLQELKRWSRSEKLSVGCEHIASRLTLNFVIHRQNLDHLEEMIAFGEESGAGRMEFAHVQYYGWAFANRERLLPTREQVDRSIALLQQAETRLRGKVRVEYVVPDYYAKYPKACMGGWGRKLILITPGGDVLPCHAAQIIPGLRFGTCRARHCVRFGIPPTRFKNFGVKNGCGSLAAAAIAARKTSAAAGASRFCSRAMPRSLIRSAR